MRCVILNNGRKFPVPGVGTYLLDKKGESLQLVRDAIDVGYRHIDTAKIYLNEKEVGTAIREKIAEGVVTREDIFLTDKLWRTNHKPEFVLPACKKALSELGLEYIDLYLIHWPIALKEGDSVKPLDKNGKVIFSDTDYVDTWKAMEELVRLGLVKSIGLSNFNSQQIERVLKAATIKPVVNQVEVHPYMNQSKLIDFCKERDIVVTAYCPLGSPNIMADEHTPAPLKDPVLHKIARKHLKTVAQVILRYLIEHGTVPIPKSSNKNRLKENLDLFDFELSLKDIAEIDALNKNYRIVTIDGYRDHKDYPFNIEY